MRAGPLGHISAIAAAVLVTTSVRAEVSQQDVVADSLVVVLEEQGWASSPDGISLEAEGIPGRWAPASWRLDTGATPTVRWLRVGAGGVAWRLGGVHRIAEDEDRTAWHATLAGSLGDAGLGSLSLHAGSGLLIGAAGRGGAPSASRSLGAGRPGWRAYGGRPESRSFAGAAGRLCVGGWDLLLAAGERDRGGRRGGGGATEMVMLGRRRGRHGVVVAAVRDTGGVGGSLGVDLRAAGATLRAEVAAWSPDRSQDPRWAWVATSSVRSGAIDLEGQLAACDPGYAPLSGVRPSVLPGEDSRGGALRLRWRGRAMRGAALFAAARMHRWVDDFPATADIGRLELVLSGRDPEGIDWRGRVATRSETIRGWSERLPWLPPAEISARRETRISARLTVESGAVSARMAAGAAGVSKRSADGPADAGWRSLVSLRADLRPAPGLEFRINQVWAWGAPVDLVSVEVPAAGFARPRHWGRRDRERSLGLGWRGPTWRFSAAVSVWEIAGSGLAHEVLVGLRLGAH